MLGTFFNVMAIGDGDDLVRPGGREAGDEIEMRGLDGGERRGRASARGDSRDSAVGQPVT
jgi:hypothetical protein